MKKNCLRCEKVFEPEKPTGYYCSDICMRQDQYEQRKAIFSKSDINSGFDRDYYQTLNLEDLYGRCTLTGDAIAYIEKYKVGEYYVQEDTEELKRILWEEFKPARFKKD